MTSTTSATTTTKLTDTQLVLLSQATTQHPERAVAIPERLRGGAVQRVVGPLLAKELVEVVPHRGEMPVYRTEADGSRLALVITYAGLLALGIEPDAPVEEEPQAEQPAPARKRKAARKSAGAKANTAGAKATPSVLARQPRTGTKQDMLIGMLKRPEGATVAEVVEATGWLPHTVRGAIAGTLKKKLGLQVSSEKVEERGRVYRIG